jgi:hypothetical protein
MRQLKIDLSEPEMAFDSGNEMISYYSGRGAFRYFKDVLLDYPAERERWFQFKRERLQQRILDWLEAHGITPLQ